MRSLGNVLLIAGGAACSTGSHGSKMGEVSFRGEITSNEVPISASPWFLSSALATPLDKLNNLSAAKLGEFKADLELTISALSIKSQDDAMTKMAKLPPSVKNRYEYSARIFLAHWHVAAEAVRLLHLDPSSWDPVRQIDAILKLPESEQGKRDYKLRSGGLGFDMFMIVDWVNIFTAALENSTQDAQQLLPRIRNYATEFAFMMPMVEDAAARRYPAELIQALRQIKVVLEKLVLKFKEIESKYPVSSSFDDDEQSTEYKLAHQLLMDMAWGTPQNRYTRAIAAIDSILSESAHESAPIHHH